MNVKSYVRVSGVVLSLVALLHVLRIMLNWDATIAGWDVPMSLSGLALVVSSYLAYTAFTLEK
jgi:hypothetical protein